MLKKVKKYGDSNPWLTFAHQNKVNWSMLYALGITFIPIFPFLKDNTASKFSSKSFKNPL